MDRYLKKPVPRADGKEYIAFATLAHRLGVTKMAINQARDKRWITIKKKNGCDCCLWPDAKDEYLAKARLTSGPKVAKRRVEDMRPGVHEEAETIVPSRKLGGRPRNTGETVASESARKVSIQSEILQLELDLKLKKLVPIAAVKELWANATDTAKQSLKAIPDRISSILAGETDEHKIFILLNREIDKALQNLSVTHDNIQST